MPSVGREGSTLKIYLASSFALKTKVDKLSKILESKGMTITRKWWHKDYKTALGVMSDEDWFARSEVQWVALENFKAIDEADILILVCPDDEPHRFAGANIEVGYAIARMKLVFSLGSLSRSAMYALVKKYQTQDELLSAIEAIH